MNEKRLCETPATVLQMYREPDAPCQFQTRSNNSIILSIQSQRRITRGLNMNGLKTDIKVQLAFKTFHYYTERLCRTQRGTVLRRDLIAPLAPLAPSSIA